MIFIANELQLLSESKKINKIVKIKVLLFVLMPIVSIIIAIFIYFIIRNNKAVYSSNIEDQNVLIKMQKEIIESFEACKVNYSNEETFKKYLKREKELESIFYVFSGIIYDTEKYIGYVNEIITSILEQYTIVSKGSSNQMQNEIQIIHSIKYVDIKDIIDEDNTNRIEIHSLVNRVNISIGRALFYSKTLYNKDNLILEVKDFAKHIFNIRKIIKDTISIKDNLDLAKFEKIETKKLLQYDPENMKGYEDTKKWIELKKYQTYQTTEKKKYVARLNHEIYFCFKEHDFLLKKKLDEESLKKSFLTKSLSLSHILKYEYSLIKKLNNLKEKKEELSARRSLCILLMEEANELKNNQKIA